MAHVVGPFFKPEDHEERMSPEERAHVCWYSMQGPVALIDIVAHIAATIRAAEEEARRPLVDALRRSQYRKPRADMVAECVGCGAIGPLNGAARKMEPEPCAPDCYIASALRSQPGREGK